ncbi:hypothetical protein MK489_08545 [Myxococcota bacterium]|nr:hypothetical protein [Myxococcota bacterium]
MTFPNAAFTRPGLAKRWLTSVVAMCAITLSSLFAVPVPSAGLGPDQQRDPNLESIEPERKRPLPILRASQALVVEDRKGFDSEYIFGMTRAVNHSTLLPALKPLAFLVTVPLDLALLPFAAIGGFF